MMHKRYLLWLIALCCITLLPPVALNLLLLKHEGDIQSISFQQIYPVFHYQGVCCFYRDRKLFWHNYLIGV